MGPTPQKQEHTQATALDRRHLRKVQQNKPCIILRGDRTAQCESRLTVHDSAFAFNNDHIFDPVSMKTEHRLPSRLFLPLTTARVVPLLFPFGAKRLKDCDTEIFGKRLGTFELQQTLYRGE